MSSESSGPQPDLSHPLVEVARRMLAPDPKEGWRLDDTAQRIIEEAILLKKDDPNLVPALLGLFEVAAQLQLSHQAVEASGRLLAVIGRVAAKLELGKTVLDRLERTHDDQQRQLTGAPSEKRALNAPAPKGAMPLKQMREVLSAHMGLQRPSRKPKK